MTDLQFHKKIEGINSYVKYIVLVPLFLITEDDIIKNETLVYYMDFIVTYFNGIERFSTRSGYTNLEYYSKLQLLYCLLISILCFFISFFNAKKIYGISKCRKIDYLNSSYYSEIINKRGFMINNERYISMCVLMFFLFDIFVFSFFIDISLKNLTDMIFLNFIFCTKIGISLISLAITYFIGIILPQIYFETVARISIKINN